MQRWEFRDRCDLIRVTRVCSSARIRCECMTWRRSVRLFFVLAVLLLPASRSAAQSLDELGAYAALAGTPIGALPPVMTSTMLATLQRSMQFSVRYGYLRGYPDAATGGGFDVGANNFAATVTLPMGLGSTVSLTAGAWYPTGQNYSSHLMLSAGGDYRLGSGPISDAPTSPALSVSLSGELGYGRPKDESLWSASVGAPIAIVTRGEGMRIAPFLVPAIGFGTRNTAVDDQSRSGVRWMVGGGVGFYNPASTLSINLGFHQAFISGSSTLVGVVFSIGSK
jgi:hypothetical protein